MFGEEEIIFVSFLLSDNNIASLEIVQTMEHVFKRIILAKKPRIASFALAR